MLGMDEISGLVCFHDDLAPTDNTEIESGYGERAAYELILGRGVGLKMVVLKGRWRCCAAGAHLINPVLQRDGDKFGISGDDDYGNQIVMRITRTQVLCLLGRDKKNRCSCRKS